MVKEYERPEKKKEGIELLLFLSAYLVF